MKVSVVPLHWIKDTVESDKMLSLIPIIESINDEKLFTSPFIEVLKEIVIMLHKIAFNYCFLPFVAQLIVCVTYFSQFVMSEESDRPIRTGILAVSVVLTTTYFVLIEI